MPAHLLARKSDAAQSSRNRVVAQRPLGGERGWKDIATTPCERLDVAQNRNRLLGQRNQVRPAHLHPMSCDPPFTGIQIDLSPLRAAEFSWSDKDQGRQRQCGFNDRVTLIAI